MKKIGVIGSGVVGQVLADGFLKHGFEVMRGSRDEKKLATWKTSAGSKASIGTFEAAALFGEVIVLAVKGTAAIEAALIAGAGLDGKVVIDTTNPLKDAPPVSGVLSSFLGPNESLLEQLQKRVPKAHFVKAFSCVGSARMVNPDFGGTKPTMFIAGDDSHAKKTVEGILTTFGWESADMGPAVAARAIEPLCILWCIPGFAHNQWTHAFKLLK